MILQTSRKSQVLLVCSLELVAHLLSEETFLAAVLPDL